MYVVECKNKEEEDVYEKLRRAEESSDFATVMAVGALVALLGIAMWQVDGRWCARNVVAAMLLIGGSCASFIKMMISVNASKDVLWHRRVLWEMRRDGRIRDFHRYEDHHVDGLTQKINEHKAGSIPQFAMLVVIGTVLMFAGLYKVTGGFKDAGSNGVPGAAGAPPLVEFHP